MYISVGLKFLISDDKMDTSMILFMIIFIFSLVNSQLLSQVPDVEEMSGTPFILTTGELYKDMLTKETSILAA